MYPVLLGGVGDIHPRFWVVGFSVALDEYPELSMDIRTIENRD
jgi:hypothetical protein